MDGDSPASNFLISLLVITLDVASVAGTVLLFSRRRGRVHWMGRGASVGIWYCVLLAGAVAVMILLFKIAASPPNNSADRLMQMATTLVLVPAAAAGVIAAFLKP